MQQLHSQLHRSYERPVPNQASTRTPYRATGIGLPPPGIRNPYRVMDRTTPRATVTLPHGALHSLTETDGLVS